MHRHIRLTLAAASVAAVALTTTGTAGAVPAPEQDRIILVQPARRPPESPPSKGPTSSS